MRMPEEQRQNVMTERSLQQSASLQHIVQMQSCFVQHDSILQLQIEETMPEPEKCTRSFMFWFEAVKCKHLLEDSV